MVKVEWVIIAAIAGWILTIVLYIYSIIIGRSDKNEDRAEKKDESRESLRFESFQKDLNHNHREVLMLVESLKEGEKRVYEELRERKEVSNEKMTLIRLLSERLTKLESRVDQLEEMKEDIAEIKMMVKESAIDTREMFEKNKDDIGRISIAMFNAGIK